MVTHYGVICYHSTRVKLNVFPFFCTRHHNSWKRVVSGWYKCLFELASKNLMRLVCIDEAHLVAQDGKDFRPEFHSAVKTLRSIYDTQITKWNRIAIPAMFRQCNQDVITDLFGWPPDKVMWLELSRRGIHFDVIVSGNPLSAVTSSSNRTTNTRQRCRPSCTVLPRLLSPLKCNIFFRGGIGFMDSLPRLS